MSKTKMQLALTQSIVAPLRRMVRKIPKNQNPKEPRKARCDGRQFGSLVLRFFDFSRLPLSPVDSREAGEGQLESVRAVAAMALGFESDVKLVGQCQAGQREPHAAGFGQGDAHVLNEVLNEEAGVEIIGDDAGAEVRE